MNHYKTLPKLFFAFHIVGIGDDTFANWANFLAGRRVVMANAFGAQLGIDHIDFIAD